MIANKNDYYDFLLKSMKRHLGGEPWNTMLREYNEKFGENLTRSSFRHRCERYYESVKNGNKKPVKNNKVDIKNTQYPENESVEYDSEGNLSAYKIIEYQQDVFGDRTKLLRKLGYDPSQWVIERLKWSKWEQSKKGSNELTNLCAVSMKLKPIKDLSDVEILECVKETLKKGLTPVQFDNVPYRTDLDPNRLMEFCPVELHMGKLSNDDETGENYDLKICKKIFEDIIKRTCQIQEHEKCGRALVVIGSDFFNSESDNCTSNNKIPQQNDTRYKKLFTTGLELYVKALMTFREMFNDVEVRICSGNHARAMEFFLYVALQQYFRNDEIVHFVEDYKDTQAIQFGNCAIFYNHGDSNLKRTIQSIPSEFYEIWGKTIYRELHLGHLHKEVTVDDEGGMITRRIGSPCATDAWHYQNRFVGATKKHQVFVWDKNDGLCEIKYINIKIKSYDK